MALVYLRITDNCNLECAHCCYECGPRKKTMHAKKLETILDNLEGPEVTTLLLGGGEPFTRWTRLEQALSSIQERKLRGKYPELRKIAVQSNGLWATDIPTAKEYIQKLASLGANNLTITGGDNFHDEQSKVRSLIRPHRALAYVYDAWRLLCRESAGTFVLFAGDLSVYPRYAAPFGRAKNLSPDHMKIRTNCARPIENITIDPQGNAYHCCWQQPFTLGSLAKLPIVEILRRDESFSSGESWIITAAKALGRYDSADAEAYRSNPCSVCEKTFKDVSIDWNEAR